MPADWCSISKNFVKQIKCHNLRFLNNLCDYIDLVQYDILPWFKALTNLYTHLLKKEIYLISAQILESFGIRCHFLDFHHNFFINFCRENVHVNTLIFLSIDFLILQHLYIPFRRSRYFPDKHRYFGPKLNYIFILIGLIILLSQRVKIRFLWYLRYFLYFGFLCYLFNCNRMLLAVNLLWIIMNIFM